MTTGDDIGSVNLVTGTSETSSVNLDMFGLGIIEWMMVEAGWVAMRLV